MVTSWISDEKHDSWTEAFCTRLSIITTSCQGSFPWMPASSVKFSTRPNVVTTPVCPVGTEVKHELPIASTKMSAPSTTGITAAAGLEVSFFMI